MNALRITLVAGVLAALSAAPVTASAASIQCWTNKQGVRECGQFVPPEYSQQKHEELNQEGLVIKRQARAKTPEELAKERQKKEEEAKKQAVLERKAQAQARHDRVLLDTFTTEDDLKLARDGKLQAIDARITHTRQLVGRLQADLADLQHQAAATELSGHNVQANLLGQIAQVRQQIADNQDFIAQRRTERKELVAQFAADLARYRELKAEQKQQP